MTNEGMGPADIAALTRNGNGGFGAEGGVWWIIILFLFAFMNGGWGGNNGGYANGAALYPWLNQSDQINNGFQNQMIYDNITGIRDAVYGLGPQLCNGFAGVTAAINNGFAQAEISENARQMAFMQQLFGLSQQFCQTQNLIQNEGSQTRFAEAQNTSQIIQEIRNGDQKIMDKLCQLELDTVKGQLAQAQRENVGLQNQINMLNLAASQVAQTADLRQNNAQVANQLISELRSCPIPAQPVYGSQPIFTCGGNGAGCGCGAVA